MATTTLNNTTIVSIADVSFMNNEIVCLNDGRHFMPSEVLFTEDIKEALSDENLIIFNKICKDLGIL